MAEQNQNTFFGIKIDEKKKKIVVPSKKIMNLVVIEKKINWTKMIIITVLIIAAGLAFTKFGILDPLAQRDEAMTRRSEKQMQLATINAKMVEYNKVEAQYGRYSYGWMNDSEAALLQKEQVLDVVEKIIAPACLIENVSVASNTMTLSISGVTLDQAREIVKQLKDDARVTSAMVYSAVASDETHAAKISMTVIFTREAAEQ